MSALFSTANEPLLCILPPTDAIIHRPYINLTDFLTSYSICLNSYEERIDAAIRGESLCAEHITNYREMAKSNAKRQRQDSGSEKKSPDSKRLRNNENEKKIDSISADELSGLAIDDKFDRDFLSPTNESNSFEMDGVVRMIDSLSADEGDKADKIIENIKQDTTNSSDEINALDTDNKIEQQEANDQLTLNISDIKRSSSISNKTKRADMLKKRELRNKDHFRPLIAEEVIHKIRQGWTIKDVGDITIGDLYLMFGQDSVVRLEYKWIGNPIKIIDNNRIEQVETICENVETIEQNKIKEETKTGFEIKTEEPIKVIEKFNRHSLSNRLQQLLLLANMMEKTKKKSNCSTCHNCNSNKVKVSFIWF